jgi:hypothetical protein
VPLGAELGAKGHDRLTLEKPALEDRCRKGVCIQFASVLIDGAAELAGDTIGDDRCSGESRQTAFKSGTARPRESPTDHHRPERRYSERTTSVYLFMDSETCATHYLIELGIDWPPLDVTDVIRFGVNLGHHYFLQDS